MRSTLLPILTALFSAGVIFACTSGDNAATKTSEDPSRQSPSDDEEEPFPEDETSSSGTSGNPSPDAGEEDDDGGSSGTTSSGGTTSSSGTVPFDGGPPVDGGAAGTKCLAQSVAESETNDTEKTADVLPTATTSFCGRIATAKDVDYAKFVWPNDDGSHSYDYTFLYTAGDLNVEAFVEGSPVSESNKPVKGKPIIFKISSAGTFVVSDYILKITYQ